MKSKEEIEKELSETKHWLHVWEVTAKRFESMQIDNFPEIHEIKSCK